MSVKIVPMMMTPLAAKGRATKRVETTFEGGLSGLGESELSVMILVPASE